MLSDNIFSLDFDVGCNDFLLQSTYVTVKCLKIIRKTSSYYCCTKNNNCLLQASTSYDLGGKSRKLQIRYLRSCSFSNKQLVSTA